MGKRAIKQQSSSKVSKKDHHLHRKHHHQQQHHQQQQFNSLIKVLKPKVYITDSSSFKQLVQDLTGNNNNNNNGSPSPIITSSSSKVHDQVHPFSVEPSVSTEAPTPSTPSEELCYDDHINNINDTDQLMMMYEEDDLYRFFSSNEIVGLKGNDSSTVFEDILACDYDQINYLESLLFDEQVVNVEESMLPSDDPFYAQVIHQQEISVYDYDFSGLID